MKASQEPLVVEEFPVNLKSISLIRVPYEQAKEEQFANCDFCNNQGEIEEEVKEDDDGQGNTN